MCEQPPLRDVTIGKTLIMLITNNCFCYIVLCVGGSNAYCIFLVQYYTEQANFW